MFSGWPRTGYSLNTPPGVILPINAGRGPRPGSVNHIAPSGPAAMPCGVLNGTKPNSTIAPAGVTVPILSPAASVNHGFPSGPFAIPQGLLFGVGTVNSVT